MSSPPARTAWCGFLVRTLAPFWLIVLALAWGPGKAAGADVPLLAFHQVLSGIELAFAELPESRAKGNGALFVALRIDPEQHDFSLSMASESGLARSLADWSDKDKLRVGINASMYLPDKITSTGFMRKGGAVNNSNLGGRLGAFFVAGPRKKGLPKAAVLDKGRPGWRALLNEYDIVVQNYRFMDSEGRALWRPGSPAYSMAVVAQDRKGRILFILNQEMMTAESFADCLTAFALDLQAVMYVEGGAQAGIFLRLDASDRVDAADPATALPGAVAVPGKDGLVHVWKGRHSLLNTRGNADAALPNVIGVRMK